MLYDTTAEEIHDAHITAGKGVVSYRHKFRDLPNGRAITVRVLAVNLGGLGEYAETLPQVPSGVQHTPHHTTPQAWVTL